MKKLMDIEADAPDEKCTCKELACGEITCKGQCGCQHCHRSYADYLSQHHG